MTTATRVSVKQVRAANGTWFNVVHIPAGTPNPTNEFRGRFGPDKAHVEFFDAGHEETQFGQFTGASYFAETLLESHGQHVGLMLWTDVPAWHLDADTMTVVRDWIAGLEARE